MTEQPRPTWGDYYDAIASQMALYTVSNRSLAEAAGLRPGQSVVDLACGSGLTTQAALAEVPEGLRLTLIDNTPSMITAARKRLGDKVAAYHVADAMDVASVVTEKVDRVLCNLTFFSFRDPEAVLRQVRQILKPTGLVLFSVLNTYFNTNGTLVSPQWALLRHLHAQGALPRGVNDVDRLPNQRSIEGTLQQVGFKPALFKVVPVEPAAPEWEPEGELHRLLQLSPLYGGEDGMERSLGALQASAGAIAAAAPAWRVVLFAAQPQLSAEEAFRLRFGDRLPGQP